MDPNSGGIQALTALAREAAEFIIEEARGSPVRLFHHIDADGLASGAIAAAALMRMDVTFHSSGEKGLFEPVVGRLAAAEYSFFISADLGSGHKDLLSPLCEGRKMIILDHHSPAGSCPGEVVEVNPHLVGLDGTVEVSSSGVAFLLYRELTGRVDMAPIALVGAVGDLQDVGGFTGVNAEIRDLAVREGMIAERTDLRLFGGPDYPLLLALERTVDPYIPGVSGSSGGALELLERLGIEPKKGDDWTRLADLSDEERRSLTSEVVKRMLSAGLEADPERVMGKSYLMVGEPRGSPLRDLRSFATVLNACGRMGRPEIGVLLCLGLRGKYLEQAMEALAEYRSEVARFVGEFSRTSSGGGGGGVLLIDGRGKLRDTTIGTVTSIISKSSAAAGALAVVGWAEASPGILKVSARLTGEGAASGINLDEAVRSAAEAVGGSGGGHPVAAGGYVPEGELERFIRLLRERLRA